MRTKCLKKSYAAAVMALAAASSIWAINVAPYGSGIMGVNDAIDGDAGTPRFNSGVAENLVDLNPISRVDSWFGNGATDQGQGISFAGVTWPFARYETISNVRITFATFLDGGWFGVNNQGPGAGAALTAPMLVEPTVQISTNNGVSWTTVPHTSDYLANFTGHLIGGGGLENPSTGVATFTLNNPVTEISGIRVIGANGGTADGNGFIGVFEFEVEGEPSADTDGDGLADAWETGNGLSVGTNDSAGDPDSDGLTNQQEFDFSTHPNQADSEGDGLNDGMEANSLFTSPTRQDTDEDGLADGAEVNTHGSDPLAEDTDIDGLNDGEEVNTHETSPVLADTDNDGYSDPVEIAQGSDATDPAIIPNNVSLFARGIMGVKASVEAGVETEVELFHVGTAENIVDGNLNTRVDTWNSSDLSTTASYVGVAWDTPITNMIASVRLTLATFFDGGWFGQNASGPGAGNALTAAHLVAPQLEITTDGLNWIVIPHSSDYLTALLGHRVGGGGQPNPTTATATFTLDQATNNIMGIRLVGEEGGTASGGFLGVFDFAALTSSTDVDNDQLDDAWERQNQLLVGTNDAAADPDSDGLSNLQEFTAETNPQQADSDNDGLNDGPELSQHNTNPLRADTDTDGLNDGPEINTHRTNPLVVDSDGDGYRDGLEVANGSNPASASSFPDNISAIATAIIGTSDAIEGGIDTPHANAGSAGAINDFNLATRVDTFNGAAPGTVSYVGLIWANPVTNPIVRLELTHAIFFDGGWFGVNNIGPGAGGVLNGTEHLVEPILQVTSDGGTTWQTVAHTSNYMEALEGHPLPAAAFGAPTTVTANFQFATQPANFNGVRIIGTEGGTASGGFLGVFELAARVQTNSVPAGLSLLNAGIAAGQFRFEFDSTTGTSHVVQYKQSLSDATWQTLTTVPGDGTRKTVTDPIGAMRFYRVQNQ